MGGCGSSFECQRPAAENSHPVPLEDELSPPFSQVKKLVNKPGLLIELNDKVKEMFQQLRLRIQDLEKMAEEQDKVSAKQILLVEEENHHKQMLSNQTGAAWRRANLACKLAIDNNEKDELLQNGDSSIRQRKMTMEGLVQTESSITDSLMRSSRMMSQQMQQSEESVRTLATSSRTIQETNEEFKNMTGTIQLGHKLVTKYNYRELTDQSHILTFDVITLSHEEHYRKTMNQTVHCELNSRGKVRVATLDIKTAFYLGWHQGTLGNQADKLQTKCRLSMTFCWCCDYCKLVTKAKRDSMSASELLLPVHMWTASVQHQPFRALCQTLYFLLHLNSIQILRVE
ncbi:LOW QUALITY PROTEIN: vesicle transport protein SEC20-like [Scyliorhinus canicula]|uniref:LOW QUALITY PROTEIN: vesicle transport protein SEC20-like n=1 Tax=Scyliorhinus canicula TaxID=7830 RepID=UPI0018F28861|nr:LOW QUALITY PROTEIN: vesicle transport protein SEC20-like [Scyliorhinus canicula]